MTLQLGDVVLIRMQFQQAVGAKIRPAVVLLDSGDDDFVAAPVTSQSRSSSYDLPLQDWQAAGLNVPSFTRVHKLAVLSKAEIARSIGVLSDHDRKLLIDVLCRAFCPNS